jgi:hypothetical protein
MFALSHGWKPFSEDKIRLYLERELAWELAENPRHILARRQFVAVAWLGGYDDLVLRLDGRDEFAWVHLSWNRETQPKWPHCELLGGVEAVNRFMARCPSALQDEDAE